MPKHRTQRVGIFVDVQNLYYSAKQFYNSKVNFAHILSKAIAGRELVRAIAYVIKADIKDEHNFFEALEKIGFDVKSKDLQTFYTGAKKGDWDVGIAMDIMRMAHKLDVVVLVSGDGDFRDLLEHVKALGCRAEVVAFGKTLSSRLEDVADELTDLGKDLEKTLIKDHRHKPMGPRGEKGEKAEGVEKTDAPEGADAAQPAEAAPQMPVIEGVDPSIIAKDKDDIPTEVPIEAHGELVEPRKQFQRPPFQKRSFDSKPPFQKRSFDSKPGFQQRPPFQQRSFDNKPGFQKRSFDKPFKRFDRGDRRDDRRDDRSFERRDDTNILQKINMEQPDLTRPAQIKQEPAVREPTPIVRQEPPVLGEDARAKKRIAKKPAPKKKVESKNTSKPIRKKL